MCRSHLQATRTELDVYIAVFNHRDFAAHKRHNDPFTLKPLVFGVGRVDAHRHVAHDGLRARSGHNGVASALVLMHHIAFGHRFGGSGGVFTHIILHVIKLGVLVLVDHFLVGKGRLELGVPVDHAHAAIDQAFPVKVHEHVDDALGTLIVHSECRAVPVARGTNLAQLFKNDAAVFVGPVPGVFEKLLTCEVFLLYAALGQAVEHLDFCGNRSVVGARHPASIFAFHTGATHENILDGFVEHMAHVQHAGHVGRGYHHRVGLAAVGL